MCLPQIATSASRGSEPVPSKTVPPRMTRSKRWSMAISGLSGAERLSGLAVWVNAKTQGQTHEAANCSAVTRPVLSLLGEIAAGPRGWQQEWAGTCLRGLRDSALEILRLGIFASDFAPGILRLKFRSPQPGTARRGHKRDRRLHQEDHGVLRYDEFRTPSRAGISGSGQRRCEKT